LRFFTPGESASPKVWCHKPAGETSPTSSGSAPDDSALGGVTGLEAVLEEFFDEFLEATAIQRYPTRGGGGRRAKARQSKQARCTGLGGKKGESLASSLWGGIADTGKI